MATPISSRELQLTIRLFAKQEISYHDIFPKDVGNISASNISQQIRNTAVSTRNEPTFSFHDTALFQNILCQAYDQEALPERQGNATTLIEIYSHDMSLSSNGHELHKTALFLSAITNWAPSILKEQLKNNTSPFTEGEAKKIIQEFNQIHPFGISDIHTVPYEVIRLIKETFNACLRAVKKEDEIVNSLLTALLNDRGSTSYKLLNHKKTP